MNITEISEQLKQTILFSALNDDELHEVAAFVRERHISAGETIIWEGDPPDWLYVVAEGKVKVVKYASSGKELIIAIFPPGNIFGEVAVFDGIPYPASAIAQADSAVLGISKTDLLSYLSQNPSVAL